MADLAKWKTGKPDEPWKMEIAKANQAKAIQTINALNMIIFGSSPGVNFEAQTNRLRGLTGDQIADQLNAFWYATQRELSYKQEEPI